MAFSDYRAMDPSTHGFFNLNGLANYREILVDAEFFASFGLTLKYTAVYVPLLVAFSLGVALLIGKVRSPALAGFYRVVAYIPVVLPVSVSMMLWRQLYNPDFGYLNSFLTSVLGVQDPPLWMALPELAFWTVLMPDIWLGFGYYTFLFLIGLYNIDPTLYEAAEIDGAGSWTKLRRITLPLLKPIFILIFVSACALGGGTLPAMTLFADNAPGGPGQAMMTVGLYGFRTAFGFGDLRMGYAASMGLVTALVSMVLAAIVFWLVRAERD
jgi:ABC-type sugar transport system permease subunit